MTDEQPAGNTDFYTQELTQNSELPAATLALTVAYDGSHFAGFARQQGLSTVQGELEQALATLYHREVLTTGAGRTDAGVHALGNVVSFGVAADELSKRSLEKLQSALNALTPDALVVKDIAEAQPDFSARFSAKAREYRYRLYLGATPPLFLEPYVWWLKPTNVPLDINAMKAAATRLEGEHDFRSFCVAKSASLGPTTRKVSKILVFGSQHLGEQCLVVQVIGNAFLHSMVRVIVGTLVEVLQQRRLPEWTSEVLQARDRRAAGQTAPAKGLTLWRVVY